MADIRKEIGREKREERLKNVFGMLAFAAILIAIYFLSLSQYPAIIKKADVYVDSPQDAQVQAKIKNATGYDWDELIEKQDGSEAEKIAALLLLANEITVADQQFDYVNRSVGISGGELSLEKINASDTSKQNVLKLIGNLENAENLYLQKGISTAKARVNRLGILKNYFQSNDLPAGPLPEGYRQVAKETTEFAVESYSQLIKILIINYNLIA